MKTTIRHIHRYITDRSRVQLTDGRTGRIVRVDTVFPSNDTTVSIWTETSKGPGVAKVDISTVLGPVAAGSTRSS